MRRSQNAASMNVEVMKVGLERDEMKKEKIELGGSKVYVVDVGMRDAEMRRCGV